MSGQRLVDHRQIKFWRLSRSKQGPEKDQAGGQDRVMPGQQLFGAPSLQFRFNV